MSIRLYLLAIAMSCCALPALAADDAMIEHGHQVFDKWCTPCHGPGAPQHPGTAALTVLYNGEKPAELEQRTDLTPEITKFYVRTGVSIMPFFRKTEVSDDDLEALAAYLARNLKE